MVLRRKSTSVKVECHILKERLLIKEHEKYKSINCMIEDNNHCSRWSEYYRKSQIRHLIINDNYAHEQMLHKKANIVGINDHGDNNLIEDKATAENKIPSCPQLGVGWFNSLAVNPPSGVPQWAINGYVPHISSSISSLPLLRAGKLLMWEQMSLSGHVLNAGFPASTSIC